MHTNLKSDSIYRDLTNSAGLGSISKLKLAGVDNPEKFLSSKNSYTLHKVSKKKFKRRPFIVKGPGVTVACDVAYMLHYQKDNDGCKYMLVFIDIFSRYLSVYPVKTIKSKDISPKIKHFFDNSIYKYSKMLTDEGVEFTSKSVNELLNKMQVCAYHTFNRDIKASHAERVIRTLKMKISRYITEFNTERYIDVLPIIVETYNHTKNRGINYKTPADVHLITNWEKIVITRNQMYKKERKQKSKPLTHKLRVGEHVRISLARKIFDKESNIKNTREIFKISKINNTYPITYSLIDLEDKEIKGTFYKEELITVDNSGDYRVNVLKSRKRRGKTEYLVKYIDFPDSKSEWVKKLV